MGFYVPLLGTKNYALRSYVWTHLFIIVQKLKGVWCGGGEGIYGHLV